MTTFSESPSLGSYSLSVRLAELPAEFSTLALPSAPRTTASITVDTEQELRVALATPGADITVLPKAGGGNYNGSYTASSSDQRIRFQEGAWLVATEGIATSYGAASSLTISGQSIHVSGPGGIAGGSFYIGVNAQDVRVDGGLHRLDQARLDRPQHGSDAYQWTQSLA